MKDTALTTKDEIRNVDGVQKKMEIIKILNEQEVLGKPFKVYGTADTPLFLAKDVALWLDLTNVTDMVSRVDEDEVTKLNLGGCKVNVIFLRRTDCTKSLCRAESLLQSNLRRRSKRY